MFQLALLLHNFDKTLWPKCHIQWLYLAAHGCKTYLNLNLNPAHRSDRGGTPYGYRSCSWPGMGLNLRHSE
jgi:hypothetical protein